MPIHDDLPSIALSRVLLFCQDGPVSFPFEGARFKAELSLQGARRERLRVRVAPLEDTAPSDFRGLYLEWKGQATGEQFWPNNGKEFEFELPREVASDGVPGDQVRAYLLLKTA